LHSCDDSQNDETSPPQGALASSKMLDGIFRSRTSAGSVSETCGGANFGGDRDRNRRVETGGNERKGAGHAGDAEAKGSPVDDLVTEGRLGGTGGALLV
jgi:hypothetical protein